VPELPELPDVPGVPGGTDRLLDLALRTGRAAAALIRERAGDGVSVAATKSSEVDVVTQTDRDSEALIRGLVAAERPDDAFLGEEGDDVAGTSGVRWVVDPIDGTVNFLYGLPEYAVSIAAQVQRGAGEWETVAAAVFNVPRAIEYAAWTDPAGVVHATKDGRPIAVRGPAPLAHRLVATGFSYDAGLRALQAQALTRMIAEVRDIRRNGAAALELCHVAEGTLDGYFEEGVHLWDFAAGAHISRGAGCRAEVLTGQTGRILVVCAPEHGFDDLRELVARSGFATG